MEHICKQCGDCCKTDRLKSYIIVYPDDVIGISKFLKLDTRTFLKEFCEAETLPYIGGELKIYFLKIKEKACYFLSKDNLCSIHESKPIQCLNTPFGYFWDKTIWDNLTCLSDKKYEFDDITDESDEKLVASLVYKGYDSLE